MADEPRTALGSAHERFLASLPERGRDLLDLCRALQAGPVDGRVVDLLWRRLLALDAAAQVFQDKLLIGRIARAKLAVGGARQSGATPEQGALDEVVALCRALGVVDPLPSAPAPDAERLAAMLRTERWSSPSLRPVDPEVEAARDSSAPVMRTVTGVSAPREVLAVLVLASLELEREVRAALPPEHCELTSTSEADTALIVIDQVAPDVVLVEAAILDRGGDALAQALRGGRAGSARAVVALVPENASDVDALLTRSFADAALRLPLSRAGLVDRLLRLAGRSPRPRPLLDALEVGTVDEIARGVAEEVRRGIAESLRLGRSERIDLGDKSELLAATWSAVSRIRAQLAQRAQGRLSFDDAPYAGGPTALALVDAGAPPPPEVANESLRGRRILLADDDPTVRWFFGQLLREAGAIAIEAEDGGQALELARRFPPDLVISDILMPVIDGFSLCRELKRDVSLSHVPVILLSWKEDFLQRVRQLDAGASGYLRKEAGGAQILATVTKALRPRAELRALLDAGDEVQGRVETLGVPGLLRAVAEARPDAHINLRSAFSLFEIDLRGGSELAVTSTAADGAFTRGARALRQLIGVESGRYAVALAHGPLRGALAEPLDVLLQQSLEDLGATLDAVSDSRLAHVERVVLDESVLGAWLAGAPAQPAELVTRLRRGEPPRDVARASEVPLSELEQLLGSLARLGALAEVNGLAGEDLIEAARRERRERPGSLMHAAAGEPALTADALQQTRVPSAAKTAAVEPRETSERATDRELATPGSRAPSSMPPPPPRGSMLASVLTLLALAAFGFFAVRLGQNRAPEARVTDTVAPAARPSAAPSGGASGATSLVEGEAHVAAEPSGDAPGAPRVLPFIDRSRGIAVAENQGLLVVEVEGSPGPPPSVRVGERELGPAPVALALPAGRHEVTLRRGAQTSFRYVLVRAGETRILELRE
jgi:DNA-binding response OmpR family regulator